MKVGMMKHKFSIPLYQETKDEIAKKVIPSHKQKRFDHVKSSVKEYLNRRNFSYKAMKDAVAESIKVAFADENFNPSEKPKPVTDALNKVADEKRKEIERIKVPTASNSQLRAQQYQNEKELGPIKRVNEQLGIIR